MGVVFVATGGDRGGLYLVVNGLAALATGVATAGAARFPARAGLGMLGGGLLAQGALRGLNVLLDLTRLPLGESLILLVGWTLAGASATAWAADPSRPRAGGVRLGLYVAGFGYFLALMTTLASGRVSAVAGLLLGTVGLLLAAPQLGTPSAGPGG
jgi:hypothetical protein